MSHYLSNLRDIEFNLFEVVGTGQRLGTAPFADLDVPTAREILAEVNRMAETVFAESFTESDRNPPVYDPATHSLVTSEALKQSYAAAWESEFWRIGLPAHLGGTACPPSLQWAVAELLCGSNPAVFLYLSGPNFAAVIDALGTEEQRAIAGHMLERQWGATMVLTEPDAGSDVGAGRAKAVEQPDGTWHISGVKRFITSGESDLSENIVHFVLARREGGPPGTKGLSLFLVPKFLFDPVTGELGARNGVYATNVEKKMGLKASATCELTFGEREPAVGYLLGDTHDGIAQMFKVIEYARMLVGTKAIATLSTGYRNALAYAQPRVQGPDLAAMADKTSPRVTIIHHPDVRRSLMLQKSYAEGMRALLLYTAAWQDEIMTAEAAGTDASLATRVNDLLLPVVKGVGSERSYEMLSHSLQTLGGSGYLMDYPIEQYLRDAKIDTLYEGTTAIQGLDLFFRKMVKDQFTAVTRLAADITETVKADTGDGRLAAERAAVGRALEDVQGILGAMGGWAMAHQQEPTALYKVGLNTTRLLMAVGDLLIGWLLLRQAEVAQAALLRDDLTPADRLFYEGKVVTAGWFAANRLPLLAAERVMAETTTDDVMRLPEGAF